MNTVTIVSISPFDWHVNRTYGNFKIPGCPKELPYSVLAIRDMRERYDIGDGRKATEFWEAPEIAKDLIQGLTQHGVFIAEGQKPTREEVEEAKARVEAWYQELVQQGDAYWAADRDMRRNGITDLHRRAAIALGLEREWSYVPKKHVACPFCQEMVKEGVVRCKHCGAILDPDKALAGGIINAEQHRVISTNRNKLRDRERAEAKKLIQPKSAKREAVLKDEKPAPAKTEPERQATAEEVEAEKHAPRPEDPFWEDVPAGKPAY